jgi:hypothetical protein
MPTDIIMVINNHPRSSFYKKPRSASLVLCILFAWTGAHAYADSNVLRQGSSESPGPRHSVHQQSIRSGVFVCKGVAGWYAVNTKLIGEREVDMARAVISATDANRLTAHRSRTCRAKRQTAPNVGALTSAIPDERASS